MSSEYLNNKNFERIILKFQHAKRQRAKYDLLLEDVKAARARPVRKGKRPEPPAWEQLFIDSAAVVKEFEQAQRDLALAFYTLSENIVGYAKFKLIDEHDAVQEGVLICFEKIDRFDPSKGKAFNYMTTCILNHFRQLYRTARTYNEVNKKYSDHMQSQLPHVYRTPRTQKNHNNTTRH